jgi:hypothetical protein
MEAHVWDMYPAVCQGRCEFFVSMSGLSNCRTALTACFHYGLISVHVEKAKWLHTAAGFCKVHFHILELSRYYTTDN